MIPSGVHCDGWSCRRLLDDGGGDALEPAMFLYTYDELVGLWYWFVHLGFWYRLV